MCSLKFCTLGKNSSVPNTAPGLFPLNGIQQHLQQQKKFSKAATFSLLILKALHTYPSKVKFTTLLDEKPKKQTLFLKVVSALKKAARASR